jgi:hypothetical protein
MAGAIANKAGAKPPAAMDWKGFRALVMRARKGDDDALPALREALAREAPEWRSWFLETFGDPSRWLRDALIRSAVGEDDLASTEGLEMRMARVRKELEGPSPTFLEKLLAERAAICWFNVTIYETLYAQSKDLTIAQAKWQVRRINAAHDRFLKSVATLARIRKLALPALQVNIAQNQVNMT